MANGPAQTTAQGVSLGDYLHGHFSGARGARYVSDGRGETKANSPDPTQGDVIEHLNRVLSSSAFVKSDRLRKFLRFIVKETLAGRAEALKEYAIALDVFGRDESFDPQTSSVVRVEASRMRAKLDNYNAIEGLNDLVHISLPAGTYVPVFRANENLSNSRSPEGSTTDSRLSLNAPRKPIFEVATASLFGIVALAFLFVSVIDISEWGRSASIDSNAIRAVAVLPLRNISGDPSQDYFSDGLTDALISNLAQISDLPVISSTSVIRYKNVDRPIGEIARELNANRIIEGSVLRVDDRVRITVQLIDAETDRTLWAETYSRDLSNVLELQDEVVRKIVTSLSGQSALKGEPVAKPLPAVNVVAYEAVLK